MDDIKINVNYVQHNKVSVWWWCGGSVGPLLSSIDPLLLVRGSIHPLLLVGGSIDPLLLVRGSIDPLLLVGGFNRSTLGVSKQSTCEHKVN